MSAKPKKAITPKRTITTKSSVTSGGRVTTRSTSVVTSGGNYTKTTSTTSGPVRAAAPKKATTAKKATTSAKYAAPALASRWVAGPGDERPMCSVIAVANSLLAAVGEYASNAELERLYRAAGGHGDSGAPVPAVLAAVAESGLAGCRLASWRPSARPSPGGVLLLDLDVTPDLHAAAYLGSGTVATWGDAVSLTDLQARIAAAWDLSWRGATVTAKETA